MNGRPESISRSMGFQEFREVFEQVAAIKFNQDRVDKMVGLYFNAMKGFAFSIWRAVAMDYALTDDKEWPKPGWFAEQCRSRVFKENREAQGLTERFYTDEECYCPAAIKARSNFFRMVNRLALTRQPEQGTFLFGLNQAVVDQVEAMERSVKMSEGKPVSPEGTESTEND